MPTSWTRVVLVWNQTIDNRMTKIRFTSEATEYVTGEIIERSTNAMIFWKKWKTPLKRNSVIKPAVVILGSVSREMPLSGLLKVSFAKKDERRPNPSDQNQRGRVS